ncbi:MAG: archease [Candidatus Helarchaeota archaeon]|nr:archease [Candidatus Helarchaeota archaeon]
MGSFKFLEHISDVYIEVQARNLSEAFEEAGKAVFATMTNLQHIEPIIKLEVRLQAEDREALLFDWLGELIYIFDTKNLIFSKIKIHQLKLINGKIELYGELWGEEFDPQKHESKTEIKAPTYSLMEIKILSDNVILRFVLDI